MPELPEVETVRTVLKRKILEKQIKSVIIYYENIIEYPSIKEFKEQIQNETIHDIGRRGKWLLFELDHYFLLSHLRMEGKYQVKNQTDPRRKHEHVRFLFTDETELRYQDTRKFGKMYLIKKEEIYKRKPLCELGLEPFDENLDGQYLIDKWKNKKMPIKTALLDQSIITGIGNIYADEILFSSKINPLKECHKLKKSECNSIIENTRKILNQAIEYGGTTIRSYTAEEGVTGHFQGKLKVHNKEGEKCPNCNNLIKKITVGGRGTYYCDKCQVLTKKG